MAALAASITSRQLSAVESDMRSNLTAYSAPVTIAVTVQALQNSSRRRLMQRPLNQRRHVPLASSTPADDMEGRRTVYSLNGRGVLEFVRQDLTAQPETSGQEPRDHGLKDIAATGEESGSLEGNCKNSVLRQLLQSGGVNLLVNVTFPSVAQSPAIQNVANSFNQAIQNNPSSVLGGFEQGWGSIAVSSVALSYVTASDSGLEGSASQPPASSPPSSSDGSVGAFVGIAVAAILCLTFVAGKLLLPPGKIQRNHAHPANIKVALY